MKRTIGIVLACVLGMMASSNMGLFAADEGEKPAGNPFLDKVVTVYLAGPTLENGQVLENAEIKEIGGRKMLVGVSAETGQEGDWTAGIPVGIDWDSVAMYYR